MTTQRGGMMKNAINSGFEAIDVRVGTLESDIAEVKQNVSSLRTDIESGMSGLAREFRSSIDRLTSQISDRSKTPWAVIFAGAAVSVTIVALVGQLSLNPLANQITEIKAQIVPRYEHERVWSSVEKRFDSDETWLRRIDNQHYEEMAKLIDQLRKEKDEALKK